MVINSITLEAKMNLIRFYKNVSLFSVTTSFIPYDLCLVVVAMTNLLFLQICLLESVLSRKKLFFVLLMFLNCFIITECFLLFFVWIKHMRKMFFSLVVNLAFTLFIRPLIYDGS